MNMFGKTATSRMVLALAAAALLLAGVAPQASAHPATESPATCCGCNHACGGACGVNCQCRSPESPADRAPVDLPKQTRRNMDVDTPRVALVAIELPISAPRAAANFFDVLPIGDGQSLVARHVRLQV
jgi:hypothetical protein